MKLNQLSLATRNALIYFVLFIIGLGGSSYILFSYSAKEILSLTEENLEHNGDLVALQFESYLNQVETDLNQLASSPLLQRYINQPNRANLDLITEEYESFLKSKQSYFQVRLLGEATGDELIRVEHSGGKIYAADFTDLQNKKDRDYFLEIVKLKKDSIYFSKIDLNKEYDAISQPITPTMRIARLLKTDSLGGVMVIINVNLNRLFKDLNNALPNDYALRILNQDGHYIIHPAQESAFTFEYGLDPVYPIEYAESPTHIMSEKALYTNEKSISKFKKLNYKRVNYQLTAIISAQNDTIFASFYSWRKKVVFVSISIAIVFLIIAFIYLRKQVRELKTITTELMNFTDRRVPHKLAINRKDEIGELARGFELMSNKVSESYALIEKARNDAQQAFEEKNEFLENMSHEIRNPLQSILGTVQILEQNQVGAHQVPYVNALRFSANQLRSLVTDVLDYGKIKRNQITLAHEWINLDEFCNELIKALKYQAISKKINLSYTAFERIGAANFEIDPTRLYQVLNNLIINAIKFTPEGGNVTLTLDKLKEGVYRFQVRDNGNGIAPLEIRKILDRSYTSDYVSGVGLGLSIVQRLLAIFGSTLNVESTVGKGSCFGFDLALRTQQNNNKSDLADMSCWNANLLQPKILILEDDPVLNDWYAFILKANDYVILNSPTQLENVVLCDLIISDLNFINEKYDPHALETALKKHLRPNGTLIFVSGEFITGLESNLLWLKPIQKDAVLKLIHASYCRLNFGQPDFSSFERDYDQEENLVKNALNVLVAEWKKDQVALVYAIINGDREKFDQITHRIITSVRRLALDRFEVLLLELSEGIESLTKAERSSQSRKIDRIFDVFITAIEGY